MMTRRSVFAALAAAMSAAPTWRPLSAWKRRPRTGGPCYRGFVFWEPGGAAQAAVWRPDWSNLEPLPVKYVEDELITLRFKPWKYGTPRPPPGFAWGGGPGPGQGTGQLAAALLLDHTGDAELTAEEAYWFTHVLDAIATLRWEMSPAWIDAWLAEQRRLRTAARLRCHRDGRHSFPIW